MERMHEMSDPAARTSCLDCLQPRWAAEVAAVTVLNWTEACARSGQCVCVEAFFKAVGTGVMWAFN